MVDKICSSLLKQKCCFLHHSLFHTSSMTYQKNRQLINTFLRMSNKFGINQTKKTKPSFAPNVTQPDVQSIVQEKRRRFVRRENALNKLFMGHITDMMAASDISQDVWGKGLEITNVKISPDFKSLFVLWIAKENDQDEDIQEQLDGIASPLRHELSQLRLVGNVPKIFFVKDKNKTQLSDINTILNKADYGEDFKPVYPTLLKTDHMRLSDPEAVEDLAMGDLNEMPPMRNDVFRVDHTKIMNEIKKAVHKSKALHRHATDPGMPLVLGDGEPPPITTEEETNSEPPMTYAEYLKSQKILKSKQRKEKLLELIELERELTEKVGSYEFEREEDIDDLYEDFEEPEEDHR